MPNSEEEKMKQAVKLSHILKPVYYIIFAIILEMINFLWLGFKATGNPEVLQVLPQYFIFIEYSTHFTGKFS